ncbi:hypothetical protein DV495_003888 [Geotrichum candidum]|uniref:Similar to Saccharomyces cerevisiae YIL050W PCL7 Pho85p cyclin of the Pho80p subfamily n=1 Tax=Geotrichum candidum TaxID=1173061 RepID=A0A0J9XBN4_GEOCN|nr:hypothetical protein DV452_005016 [Geotrichum candidum]KAI9210123.1 hypothetical protein DS838_004997 [Geotrichum bryndzae]KAF5111860.1 hypothetical protein DV454_004535 [Geotrichum candidum]KAF5124599.1 hypothetical protein DV495_003888 [Geotrichum candidum]KAF7499301.1 hypothetical protein DV113_002655 [Geotrichum candidum]
MEYPKNTANNPATPGETQPDTAAASPSSDTAYIDGQNPIHDVRNPSSSSQYEYLQKQQLAQQAFAKQLHHNTAAEPIGIDRRLPTIEPNSFNASNNLNASSYFSFGATGNGPSSVSSSYKSAVPPNSASYHTAFSPYQSESFTGSSYFNSGSVNHYYHNKRQNASSHNNAIGSPSTSPQSDPPINQYRTSSISEGSFKQQPTIRTSLLTSKLAAAAQNNINTSGSSSNNTGMSSSNTEATISFHKNNNFASSSVSAANSNFANHTSTNSAGSFKHGAGSFNTNSSSVTNGSNMNSVNYHEPFLPHPSSTTTNISMETATTNNSSNATTPAEPTPTSHEEPEPMDIDPPLPEKLDIATFPVSDVITMLTALLQKIINANDTLHPHDQNEHQTPILDFNNSNFTANVLAFHGRNVPAIGLEAYLVRILKYCPTTNEVFISLLVYFDRIAQRANNGEFNNNGNGANGGRHQLFVMDSYNIHRLIIAGITVASKFFSDVFYKNSRYAKVGGLPVEELNHLELQFLLLTDFRLMIPIEELQRYADLLLGFWKKEQRAKTGQQGQQGHHS